MADGALRRLFWRVADALGYLLTLAWLHILDGFAGPEPPTPADEMREAESRAAAGGVSESPQRAVIAA